MRNILRIKSICLLALGLMVMLTLSSCIQLKYGAELGDSRIDEAAGFEIEKKWIIDPNNIGIDLSNADVFEIVQTYTSYEPEKRIRKITNADGVTFYMAAEKSYVNDGGLIRNESDYYIDKETYEERLNNQVGDTIYKTRYQIIIDDRIHCIDIFHEQLDGLGYLEIEFESEEEANNFIAYDWVLKDVTDDRRYKNQSLAREGIPGD